MQRPGVQYALVDGDSVAYCCFGSGDCDVMFLNTLMASIDAMWEHPAHLRSWRTFDPDLRVAALDHRGYGVSDPIDRELRGDVDERVKDVLAVADAVDMPTFGIIAEMEQTELAIRLAIDHPERVQRLVLCNGIAAGSSQDDYTSGYRLTDDFIEFLRGQFGSGALIPMMAPHMAGDAEFAARFERLGGSPGVFAQFLRKLRDVDIRALLPEVRVPTLVVHTGDYTINLVEESRYIAAHIPDAELFEVTAPNPSFYWGGGSVDRVIEFLTARTSAVVQRDLATVMFIDIVNSTEMVGKLGDAEWRRTLDFVDDLVADRVTKYRGRVVKQTGDGHLAEFARPSDAVRAGLALSRDARVLGVEVRVGLHTGEVERRGDDLGGIAVHVADRVSETALPNEVLLSRTVADLIGGSDFALDDAGFHALKGIEGEWRLYRASRPQR